MEVISSVILVASVLSVQGHVYSNRAVLRPTIRHVGSVINPPHRVPPILHPPRVLPPIQLPPHVIRTTYHQKPSMPIQPLLRPAGVYVGKKPLPPPGAPVVMPTQIPLERATMYPTKGNGVLVQHNWPADMNTFHPKGSENPFLPHGHGPVNPGGAFVPHVPVIVLPHDGKLNPDMDKFPVMPAGLNPHNGFNEMGPVLIRPISGPYKGQVPVQVFPTGDEGFPVFPQIPIFPEGQLQPVAPEVKLTEEAQVNVTQIKPILTDEKPVVDVGQGSDGVTALPITLEPAKVTEKSCMKTGCDTGYECVFGGRFMCPSAVPDADCYCVRGCRLEELFIPAFTNITLDHCGNTCSCNNLFGAVECTQRMCDPAVVPELAPQAVVPEMATSQFPAMQFPQQPVDGSKSQNSESLPKELKVEFVDNMPQANLNTVLV